MAIPKILGAQRDFSAGELDVTMKRADDMPMMKQGARQMLNWRLTNAKIPTNRPGRSAQFVESGRVEEVTMSPGNTFYIVFNAAGHVKIYSLAGVVLLDSGNLPWQAATLQNVVWAVFGLQIFITFPAMGPRVITWDGVSTWSILQYNEAVVGNGQKRTFFYRISPQNVTMLPSATTGNISLTFSSPIFTSGVVGTRMRFCGRQVLITGFGGSNSLNATVIEPLAPGMTLTLTGAKGNFAIGDVVSGSSSGAEGIVTTSPNQQGINFTIISGSFPIGSAVTGGTSGATGVVISNDGVNMGISLSTSTAFVNGENVTAPGGNSLTVTGVSSTAMTVQLLPKSNALSFFATSDTIVGLSGTAGISAVATTTPQAVSVWDDEVMNPFRGYPASVFVDQFRLGFTNFPTIPNAIGWSAINSPTDLYVDGSPQGAILDVTPGKSQVYFVVPGPESGEFVFCDNRIYYIPITTASPLVSGNVEFNLLSSDGAANIQPRAAEELIFYVTSSATRVRAIVAPGAYFRPFNTVDVSENHIHLFSNIIALATPSTDAAFPERYCYALNANGTLAVGKFSSKQGQIEGTVGWLPWSGAGTISWVSATVGSDVIFSSSYFNGVMIEKLDATQYLDDAVFVNNLPAALAPPGGLGPLWFVAGQSVTLIDQGTRMMGTYQVDVNGNIIPQNNAGENLASRQLVAGQPWTAVLEPFVPDANPGNSVHQRMFKRRVSRMAVYVSSSTGFVLARLFSGPLTRTSPALGTIMNIFRVPAWFQDDDPTQPPPLREEAQRWRPLGRAYDPRVALIKDSPGPLVVHEFGIESSI